MAKHGYLKIALATLFAAVGVGAAAAATHGVRSNALLTHLSMMAYGGTTTSGAKNVTTQAGSSGTVSTEKPGSSTSVAVSWDSSSFATPVTLTVNPSPALAGSTQLIGNSNALVSVVVTDPSTGQQIHKLAAPIDVVFTNPPKTFVPAVSDDGGVTYRAVPKITAPPLPADKVDGYYTDASGNIHILTRHVTIFGAIYKANLTNSETGRKLAPAGSGKFGDPTRIHVGPPAFRWVAKPAASGNAITYTFFVDEQVALYVHALAGGSEVSLEGSSTIRLNRIGGVARKTLHIVILRPGTIRMTLRLPSGASGATVSLIGRDYDGHKATLSAKAK